MVPDTFYSERPISLRSSAFEPFQWGPKRRSASLVTSARSAIMCMLFHQIPVSFSSRVTSTSLAASLFLASWELKSTNVTGIFQVFREPDKVPTEKQSFDDEITHVAEITQPLLVPSYRNALKGDAQSGVVIGAIFSDVVLVYHSSGDKDPH